MTAKKKEMTVKRKKKDRNHHKEMYSEDIKLLQRHTKQEDTHNPAVLFVTLSVWGSCFYVGGEGFIKAFAQRLNVL